MNFFSRFIYFACFALCLGNNDRKKKTDKIKVFFSVDPLFITFYLFGFVQNNDKSCYECDTVNSVNAMNHKDIFHIRRNRQKFPKDKQLKFCFHS